jgi:hypothetical protein
MESFNLEISNSMNISPSLTDQTNRTPCVETSSSSGMSNGFVLSEDRKQSNGDHLQPELISEISHASTTSASTTLTNQQQPSTPSKHYSSHMNSNKENLKK